MAMERLTATVTTGGESAVFECNICFDLAQDPVITMCGHLHCWPCIYKWLKLHPQCPVCKTLIQEHELVPLYGRGKASRDITLQNAEIPRRPPGRRPKTAEAAAPRALSNFEGSFGVGFHEFYGGSLRFNYGLIGEGEQGNDKTMIKILVFILMLVLFDFMAM